MNLIEFLRLNLNWIWNEFQLQLQSSYNHLISSWYDLVNQGWSASPDFILGAAQCAGPVKRTFSGEGFGFLIPVSQMTLRNLAVAWINGPYMDSPSFDRSVYGRLWWVWQKGTILFDIRIISWYIMIISWLHMIAQDLQVDFMLILFDVILIYFDVHMWSLFSMCSPVSVSIVRSVYVWSRFSAAIAMPLLASHGQSSFMVSIHHASDTKRLMWMPSGQRETKLHKDFIKVHRRRNIKNNLFFDYQL